MLEYIIGVTLCPLLAGGCKNIYNAGYCEVSCCPFFCCCLRFLKKS